MRDGRNGANGGISTGRGVACDVVPDDLEAIPGEAAGAVRGSQRTSGRHPAGSGAWLQERTGRKGDAVSADACLILDSGPAPSATRTRDDKNH